ncbi:hypothetical protein HMPREF9447_03020 [Bacteroides oleiciplenus YIT 12058]|uniref:Uncharacterized protein n=1 Tax=Bacteroides oleiciplenus YIT 12058 TaxID=742727 RepID=K9EF60_9BACE|nr:hypothetical protein HMPREF9447_03020 [Bacteroides oleiciplenus YIT 12058]
MEICVRIWKYWAKRRCNKCRLIGGVQFYMIVSNFILYGIMYIGTFAAYLLFEN